MCLGREDGETTSVFQGGSSIDMWARIGALLAYLAAIWVGGWIGVYLYLGYFHGRVETALRVGVETFIA